MSDVKEYGRGTLGEGGKDSGLRKALRSREMSLGIVILVVIAGLSFLKPEAFISLKNFEAISNGMIYDLLLAAGLTIVLILWGIDLSVGSVMALTGVITALLLRGGVPIPVAVILGLATSMACGPWWRDFCRGLRNHSGCRSGCYAPGAYQQRGGTHNRVTTLSSRRCSVFSSRS
jgi:hypothetical protein